MARKRGRTWHHGLDVVGLRFRVKKATRQELAALMDKSGEIKGIKLIREPENPMDPNAIAVFLPQRVFHGMQIGYLRSASAELLAPKMDSGYLTVVSAQLISLYSDDDWNSGELSIIFRDNPLVPTKKGAKPSS